MTQGLRFLGALVAVVGATSVACSSDEGGSKKSTPDGGGGSGGSGGSAGSAGAPTCSASAPKECCSPDLPVMVVRKSDMLVAPDWSCIVGGGTAGSGGAAGSGAAGADSGVAGAAQDGGAGAPADAAPPAEQHRFAVENFGGSGLVVDVEVELFAGNGIVDKTAFVKAFTKGPANPYPAAVGLNNGEFFYDPPPGASTLSYRVNEKPGVAKRFVGFDYPIVAPPGTNSGATVTPALYNQLATFAVPLPNWSPPEDLAILAAPIRDCAENDVGGALFRFLDESGTPIPTGEGERDIRYIYFDGQYPNPRCNHTDHRQALILVANASANAEGASKGKKFTIEFMGRLTESDAEPVVFARQDVEVFANSVNVYNILPNVRQ